MDTVGNQERRIEPYAELTNKAYISITTILQPFHKCTGSRVCDSTQVFYKFFFCHTNARVFNDQCFLVLVCLNGNLKSRSNARGRIIG